MLFVDAIRTIKPEIEGMTLPDFKGEGFLFINAGGLLTYINIETGNPYCFLNLVDQAMVNSPDWTIQPFFTFFSR